MEDNCVVYAETVQASQMKTLFEILKDILIDAPIEFIKDMSKINNTEEKNDEDEQNGCIRIISVNRGKTLIIRVLLYGKQFTKFKCNCENFVAGVCLEDLYKLVKSSSKSDNMIMYIDEMSIDKLSFMFSNSEKNKISKASLNLIDLDKFPIQLSINCDVAITINASDFRDICKEMSNITQDLEIICTKKTITFIGNGDSSKQEIIYHTDDSTGLKIKMDSKITNPIVQGIFPLKYLLTISKCANICKFAILYMKNAKPLFIDYTVATLGSIRVAITPKIKTQLDDKETE